MKEELGTERPKVAKVKQVQNEMTIEILLRLESNKLLAKVSPGCQAECIVKVLYSF